MNKTHLSAIAPAKVNLNLHILGKNAKGYHLLDSLVVFTDFGDEIHIKKSEKTSYIIKDSYNKGLLMDENNLVVKAHKSLQKATSQALPCEITLIKNLPMAAGIGGGSSDGATTLKLINQLFQLNFNEANLMDIGLSLGADFPVCIHGQACFMSGIGEIITPIKAFPKLYMALINPKKATETAQVFRLFNQSFSAALKYSDSFDEQNLFPWLKQSFNDLEKPACQIVPEISAILEALKQISAAYDSAIYHYGMSGSGATCYIISPSLSLINEVEKQLHHKDYLWLKGKIL